MEPTIRLLVGLGNPDSKYFRTRHNIGREFIDFVAEQHNLPLKKSRQAEIIRLPAFFSTSLAEPIVAARLMCYMNESGPAIKSVMMSENIKPEQILVIVDDFMIPFGTLRLRPQGSSGGHNGLKSIIETLGSDNFGRLRIGVGPVPENEDPADFVLQRFTKPEQANFSAVFNGIRDGVSALLDHGFQKAMTVANKIHV